MRCPQCAFENPPGMRFCGQCGGPLATRCPHCGADRRYRIDQVRQFRNP